MVMRSFDEDKGDPRFPQKIDVLDMIIGILGEHEEKFGELVEQLEIVTHVLSKNKPNMGTDILDDLEEEEEEIVWGR